MLVDIFIVSNCTISGNDSAGIFLNEENVENPISSEFMGSVSICNVTAINNNYGLFINDTNAKSLVCNSIFYDNTVTDFSSQKHLNIFNSVFKTFEGPNETTNCFQENPLLEPKYKENEDWIEYYIPQSGSSAINLANRNLVTEDFLTKFDDGSFLYNLMSSLYYNLNFNRANYFDSLLNYDQIGNKRKIENGRYTAGSIDYNTGSIYEKFATVKDFEVFPNPTVDKIHLQFNLLNSDVLEISLFDILGKTIKTFINNSFFDIGEHCIDLDLSNIISGHYYLNITNSKNNNFIQPIKIEK